MEIRELAITDYDEVLDLWQASEGIGLGVSDTREAIAAFLARNPGLCFAARDGGVLVGSVLCGHDGRRAYLYHLAVAASHRRRGVGRALAALCLEALRTLGIERCHLFVFRTNTAARGFWEREGWWERDDLWMMTREVLEDDPVRSAPDRARPSFGGRAPHGGQRQVPAGTILLNDGARAMPRVSVLLPVRDGAATLPAALASLHAQTFADFRVIAVDDGSADDSPRILREAMLSWGANAAATAEETPAARPSLTVVRLDPGAGIAGALIAAAQAAGSTEFYARQDADDLSHPERFERQVEFLDAHPETGLVATGVHTLIANAGPTDGWRRYERWLAECITPEEIARALWIESPLPHPTVMMRRSAYEQAGGYREVPWAEDYDLWLRMLGAGIAMAKIPEPLYDWADHPGRATRNLPAYTPEAFHACRAHHLARHLDGRRVVVWGAGRDGRRAARAMLREGIDIQAFLDIDPGKIGRTAYGRPILEAEDWLATRRAPHGLAGEESAIHARAGRNASDVPPIVLAAVGTAGARALIRARLVSAGMREGSDFLCIA